MDFDSEFYRFFREMFVGCAIQASVMQFSTIDPNHFYVGTDRVSYFHFIYFLFTLPFKCFVCYRSLSNQGWVVHCTRYGGRTHPKVYRPETGK